MIDNIITNTLLPDLSREILKRSLDGTELTSVNIGMDDEAFDYQIA